MLPTATDNGGRLAAIVPTGLAALALGHDQSPETLLADISAAMAAPPQAAADQYAAAVALLPPLRSLVVIAVDGLGSANLKARKGHAPTLASLPQRRITTVSPSTTAAALTSLATGQLPGAHGLVGYQIRHPELGLVCPLRDWEGITDPRSWQLAEPLFHRAGTLGITARAYGRSAHEHSGLTRAILSGASYVGGDTMVDRLRSAKTDLASGAPALSYVYIDELDRAGHQEGWESKAWSDRLEQLDRALADFLTGLPAGTGVVITADHGMVDVSSEQQIVFDLKDPLFAGVEEIAGEPRFRTFFLREGEDPRAFAAELEAREGRRAWVATRAEAFESGMFGDAAPAAVRHRIGDVVLAARAQCAYYSTSDDPRALEMVGQHGSLTDEEKGIPLILAGALSGTGFAKAVELVALARSSAASQE